jgi:hypothetical protein
LWARGFMWSLPAVTTSTGLITIFNPGNKINKLIDRGIFINVVSIAETVALQFNFLRHSVPSLQKVLRVVLLWGVIVYFYYLCNKLQKFIKNSTLRLQFKTSKSIKKYPLCPANLEKENFFDTKVKSIKITFK